MRFEFLTFVPIDVDGIDRELMTDRDVELLNEYHQQVYEKISPYLPEKRRGGVAGDGGEFGGG